MFKFGEKAVFKCTMAKFILSITILLVIGYQIKAVSLMKGKEAKLHFPYPCDSTVVTLQQSNKVPLYRSSDGPGLSLSQDQVQRFKVQNRNNTENCSLDLTISNLLHVDRGRYILSVYKNGEKLLKHTHKILLDVDYPPGKASCVVSEDKGGEWVSIDCTAKVGTLSGKIECYQHGVWMPPLTDPTETDTLLNQIILIRKSLPAFCCSSPLPENIEICECDDNALYLDNASTSDPCPTTSTKTSTTTIDIISDLVEKSQSFNSLNFPLSSYTTSNYTNIITKDTLNVKNCWLISVAIVVIIIGIYAFVKYKSMKQKHNV